MDSTEVCCESVWLVGVVRKLQHYLADDTRVHCWCAGLLNNPMIDSTTIVSRTIQLVGDH